MKRFLLAVVLSFPLLPVQAPARDLRPGAQSADAARPVSLRPKPPARRRRGELAALVFSPDGKVLAAAVEGGQTELWDAGAGRLIATLEGRIFHPFYRERPGDVFTPDGQTLVTMDGKEAKLWDAATGQLRRVLRGHTKDVRSLAVSPDGARVATGGADGRVVLWETGRGLPTASLNAFEPKSFSPLRILSSSIERKLAYVEVSFSRDGRRLLTARHGEPARLWEAGTGRLVGLLGVPALSTASFSPDSRFVLTQDATVGGPAYLWDAEAGELKATFLLPSLDAGFSPDGRWLGVVRHGGEQGLLSLKTLKVEVPLLAGVQAASQTLFNPDGRTFLLAGGWEKHALLVDIRTRRVVSLVPLAAERGFDFVSDFVKYVESLSYHPSGRVLLGANRKNVRLLDAATGDPLLVLDEGRGPAAFSPDGKTLAAVGQNQKDLMLWAVEN